MTKRIFNELLTWLFLVFWGTASPTLWGQVAGSPGDFAVYRPKAPVPEFKSNTAKLTLSWGFPEEGARWLSFTAESYDGHQVKVWLLGDAYPPRNRREAESLVRRYLVKEGDSDPMEYVNACSGKALLPAHGYWPHQIPRSQTTDGNAAVFPDELTFWGHEFKRVSIGIEKPEEIPEAHQVMPPCHFQIGSRSNRRDDFQPRRYDDAEVELVPYDPDDFSERLQTGQTSFLVSAEHVDQVRSENVYYTGDNTQTMPFPAALYRSNYLGPSPDYLDEPAVVTSFQWQRELREKPALAEAMTIESVLTSFKDNFRDANYQRRTTWLQRGLDRRPDVDTGSISLVQENLWLWEVHLSSAAYQLAAEREAQPTAVVFEGRGVRHRDLPLFNSSFGSQIPTSDHQAWLDMIYGMMRGAARTTGKHWGMAIYGQTEVTEVIPSLTYAYDLGASYFLYWTGARGHHVPYEEQLTYSRALADYARRFPDRDLNALREAAEVMILFPPGYVLLTKEPMWWLEPLNYEKQNAAGRTIREVLACVAAEIERCYRAGVPYDLAWDLPELDLEGYRELVRVLEDGSVVVESGGIETRYVQPRWPSRPSGSAPEFTLKVSHRRGAAPLFAVAQAELIGSESPVRFTPAHDAEGVWRNSKFIWQLYGPGPNAYRHLSGESNDGLLPLELDKPGDYRLRVSVVDLAGRSSVKWATITVE